MTPNRALALGRQRYPSGPRTGRIHAAVPATSGVPQTAPGGRAYQTHRTHGRKISCIRLYLSLGAVRGRAASRCDPLRLIPRLGRICVSDTFVFVHSSPLLLSACLRKQSKEKNELTFLLVGVRLVLCCFFFPMLLNVPKACRACLLCRPPCFRRTPHPREGITGVSRAEVGLGGFFLCLWIFNFL